MKLKFKRIYNSLKRKKLSLKKNTIINLNATKNYLKTNNSVFFILLLLVIFDVSFSQKKETSSVWLSIYNIHSETTIGSYSVDNYESLFYRKINVPVFNKPIDTNKFHLVPLANDLTKLLNQTHLNNSYSVSDLKGTEIEKSLREFEKFSFPFSNYITSELAESIDIKSSNPQLVSKDSLLHGLTKVDSLVVSTQKMFYLIHENSDITIDKKAYLRFRLLSFLIGNYNLLPNDYSWKLQNDKIQPYMNNFDNQFMKFDGTFKLISKMISRYKHFENYEPSIKNLKNVSSKYIGFDVNILSSLNYEVWRSEVDFIKNGLTSETLQKIQVNLPKGITASDVEYIFSVLRQRISNLDQIANAYYNLVSPNKIIVANNLNNIIDIKKSKTETVIEVFNAKDGKVNPIQSHHFSTKDTKEIWIYGLDGNDYFDVSGKSNSYIPIKLIGGGNSDKYEIQNGKKVAVYDNKQQTFIVSSDKANLNFSNEKFITTYQNDKYKHKTNLVKPRFGANPDDGLFIGAVNEYKTLGFDQNPFSTLHSLSANLYLGTLGLKIDYYTEKANFYKGFNAFGGLGFQSSNYSTNFFGFGNETIYDVNQKQDYNRIRMSTIDAKIGVLKKTKRYNFSTNLFFESIKIDNTPNRFVSSETLFFPSDDFFDRKNYVGLSVNFAYKDNVINNLKINPQINIVTTVDIQDFNKTNVSLQPKLSLSHPMYANKITLDATISYQHVLGTEIPFYQAANLGGSTGLRGYRNQRFTGQSLCYISSNIKWHIKDVKSDILPIKFGVLGGFDVGSVWQENEDSSQFHTDFGAGIWLQTAELIKARLQGFKGSEDFRFEINVSIGF